MKNSARFIATSKSLATLFKHAKQDDTTTISVEKDGISISDQYNTKMYANAIQGEGLFIYDQHTIANFKRCVSAINEQPLTISLGEFGISINNISF